mmetsp:Transcript_11419/g.25425  ORF Transcript_11419/g.25425 Transcript_11419/m.25425 type:complete len:226 (+) Transcript_11419:92-769(+)
MPVLLVPAAIVGYKLWQDHKKKKQREHEEVAGTTVDDIDHVEETEIVVIETLDENGVPVRPFVIKEALSTDETMISPNTSFSSEDAAPAVQDDAEIQQDRTTLESMKRFLARHDLSKEADGGNSSILKPIVRVNSITPNSPAHASGLKEGDLIVRFGNTTHASENPLQEIAQVVPQAAAQNLPIEMEVVRKGDASSNGGENKFTLQLKPEKWDGKGLVGFHIIPC